MTFSSSGLRMISQGGLALSGAALAGGGQTWLYQSSDSSTQVIATGYFAGTGAKSRSGSNANAPAQFGVQLGDLVVNMESSGGATPGRVTWHSAKGSTANVASTSASSGYSAAYDITVSAAAT